MTTDIRIKIHCDVKPFLRGIKNAQLMLYQIHGWRRFLMPGYWMTLLGIPNAKLTDDEERANDARIGTCA